MSELRPRKKFRNDGIGKAFFSSPPAQRRQCNSASRELRHKSWVEVIPASRWRVQSNDNESRCTASFQGPTGFAHQRRLASSFFPSLQPDRYWQIHSIPSRRSVLRHYLLPQELTEQIRRLLWFLRRPPFPFPSDHRRLHALPRAANPPPTLSRQTNEHRLYLA